PHYYHQMDYCADSSKEVFRYRKSFPQEVFFTVKWLVERLTLFYQLNSLMNTGYDKKNKLQPSNSQILKQYVT
ncbi:hypothetical protein MXB_2671, partial [Myxobolus squamalis]